MSLRERSKRTGRTLERALRHAWRADSVHT
jgi:hypothetical protein